MKIGRRLGLAGTGGLFLMAMLVAPASAHATYEASDPPDQGTVSSAPSSLWADFSEPLASSSSLRVEDPCGEQVDGGDTSVTGYRMTISMSSDKAGRFTVYFSALSTVDGHRTEGTFSFTAADGASCGGDPEPKKEKPGEGSGERAGGGTNGEGSGDADEGSGGRDDADVAGEPTEGEAKGSKTSTRSDRKKSRNDLRTRSGSNDVLTAPDDPLAPAAARSGDLSLDGLVIGLSLAVLIGAAGGLIYAGIMGPRTKD